MNKKVLPITALFVGGVLLLFLMGIFIGQRI